MEWPDAVRELLPPEGVIMQRVMGGWVARAISDVSRLNILDVLNVREPMSAAELVASGIDAKSGALERLMRICASIGVFTEDPQGKFGPTPLSDVLTCDSPVSVKVIAQEAGGLWVKLWTALADAIRHRRAPGATDCRNGVVGLFERKSEGVGDLR